ncbi:uncharacterized protein CDAR_474451 [Caerostris darwini]|uniref:EF-hand domain-containing protein n=1 Tax=Caerostris darwini TaxID=1538125 RepID=A0AAV4M506_9ARAC|nr:uncharacterized protein CDAR_474451 [Caerostris darwini]
MAEITNKTEKLYFGRTSRPHCRTCVCPQDVKVKSKVKIATRKAPPRQEKGCCCECHVSRDTVNWQNREEYSSLHQHKMKSPTRIERRVHPDHKYKLLESWFKRFDFDGNGLIDLFELRTMLNFLGVSVGEEYCQRLLGRADRDRDGRLTFPEFLLMWREAQDEDELIEVIREHDLFPDVIKIDYYRKKPEQVETIKRTTRNHSECPCGCEYTTTETYRKSPKEESVVYDTTTVSRKSDERLPVFSCYR